MIRRRRRRSRRVLQRRGVLGGGDGERNLADVDGRLSSVVRGDGGSAGRRGSPGEGGRRRRARGGHSTSPARFPERKLPLSASEDRKGRGDEKIETAWKSWAGWMGGRLREEGNESSSLRLSNPLTRRRGAEFHATGGGRFASATGKIVQPWGEMRISLLVQRRGDYMGKSA